MYEENYNNEYRTSSEQADRTEMTGQPVYSSDSGSKREKRSRKKKNPFVRSLCCALIIGSVSGSMIMGSMAAGSKLFPTESSAESTQAAPSTTTSSLSTVNSKATETPAGTYTVSEIAKNCMASVVSITNKGVTETMTMFGMTSAETESAGSGVIIAKTDDELIIATNYHVIEGSKELTVCFNDSEDAVYEASIKGTDSANDLAVIAVDLSKISDDVLSSIKIADLGDSDSVAVGDQVVAIGNALGSGQSVTSGYVSALNREVTTEVGTAYLIQTDAAINPGNSGGALFNMQGELIGINSAKYSDTDVEGMGFAIPMSTAQEILEDLMTQTSRSRLTEDYGYLGIYGEDVDASTSQMYGIPEGVYITQVADGSPAAAAGLLKGDIITAFDGKTVSSLSSLQDLLQYYAAGETVKLTIQRSSQGEYKAQELEITLGSSEDRDTTEENNGNAQSGQNGTAPSDGQNDGSAQPYGPNAGNGTDGSQMFGGDSSQSLFDFFFGN